jgi:hypothetical protein
VCAGLVLLLPEPVSSDHDLVSDAGTTVCNPLRDASPNHEWTNDAGINAPDSCDDDEDDDDGDDDSAGGSGHAIAGSHHEPAHLDAALHLVHVDVDFRVFRPLDAHSLRGPPSIHQESSDADVDDDDDEHLRADHSAPPVAATRREPHVPVSVHPVRQPSLSSGHALRAPPQ